ncbi:MAG: serine hydrolase domain-containing protein [Saprospiraceae bacterium]
MKNILNISVLICLTFITIFFSNCGETPQATIIKFQPKAVEYDYSDSTLFKKIDVFFQKRYQAKRFNGVALFAKNGKIVYHKAFGLSNFSTKDTLQLDDAFQLASVSKTITAVATLKLVQDSLIQLDENVQDFIPNFPYDSITVRHLLSHRSGLANYMYFADKIWENRDSSITNNDVLTIMQRDTPNYYYLPDVRYFYCNTNYAILASIIEKVTHDTYENYLDKTIFKPLKMENAFVYNRNTQPEIPQEVIGYNAIYRQKENSYFNGVVGDKGIYASVMDLFKFDQALYETDFIDSTLLAEAFSPQHPDLTRRNRDNYGLGWRIQQPSAFNQVVYHNGWWKGFKTYFIRMIGTNQTIIVLTNVTRGGYLDRMELQGLLTQINADSTQIF